MAGWSDHTGLAVALAVDNIDTDQLIPARFMSIPRTEGYGDFLLHDMRRDDDESLLSQFPLNRHNSASILVAGHNFGSGSSREAAVYALVDAGFRAVLAPSFGDIFTNNAVNNGLLPARVTKETARALTSTLADGVAELSLDLDRGTLTCGNISAFFDLDESWRIKLINGWDDIDLTLQHADRIERYQADRNRDAPWAMPAMAD